MKIQENVSLKELTTMKVGGTARYFCSVEKAEELTEALAFAREKKRGCAVLGGGSNTLIANGDIDALVIKIDIKGIDWNARGTDAEEERGTHAELLVVGAGESWDGLVAKVVRRGLWGIENLSGIPGTVGAAPIQNIGAYGTELKETLAWVDVFDTRTGKLRRLSNKECEFGYRDSVFKHKEGKSFIVTRVALRLKKSGVPNLEYKDLKNYFYGAADSSFPKGGGRVGEGGGFSSFPKVCPPTCPPIGRRGGGESSNRRILKSLGLRPLPLRKGESPTLLDIRRAVLEIRSNKFPDLRKCGTAGSFFKNPIIPRRKFNELKQRFPNLPGFPLNAQRSTLNAVKIPLAWILDNICGLKGYAKGNVRLFERQPIVLVQNGSASFEEIEAFAEEIAERVKKVTGINIEWEVQCIR